jgi:hypothetical protein
MVSDGLSMLDLAIKAGARALTSAGGRAVQAVVAADVVATARRTMDGTDNRHA